MVGDEGQVGINTVSQFLNPELITYHYVVVFGV